MVLKSKLYGKLIAVSKDVFGNKAYMYNTVMSATYTE